MDINGSLWAGFSTADSGINRLAPTLGTEDGLNSLILIDGLTNARTP